MKNLTFAGKIFLCSFILLIINGIALYYTSKENIVKDIITGLLIFAFVYYSNKLFGYIKTRLKTRKKDRERNKVLDSLGQTKANKDKIEKLLVDLSDSLEFNISKPETTQEQKIEYVDDYLQRKNAFDKIIPILESCIINYEQEIQMFHFHDNLRRAEAIHNYGFRRTAILHDSLEDVSEAMMVRMDIRQRTEELSREISASVDSLELEVTDGELRSETTKG